jgi:hypothetical protein
MKVSTQPKAGFDFLQLKIITPLWNWIVQDQVAALRQLFDCQRVRNALKQTAIEVGFFLARQRLRPAVVFESRWQLGHRWPADSRSSPDRQQTAVF